MKVDIETIQQVLEENKFPQEKVNKVINDIEKAAEEIKQEQESVRVPRAKNEMGVVLFAEDKELFDLLKTKELTAHIYQVKQGFDHASILQVISDSSREHNNNTKKKSNMIDTIGSAFANIKRKFSKAANWQNKTRQITRVTVSNNKLIE